MLCQTVTSATPPTPAPRGDGISRVIGMPLRAVCLLAVMFATKASALVFCLGYGFHMTGIDAMPNAAKVVDLQPVRNWGNKPFIAQAMGFLNLRANPEMAVATPGAAGNASGPNPTASKSRGEGREWSMNVYLSPKTFLNND